MENDEEYNLPYLTNHENVKKRKKITYMYFEILLMLKNYFKNSFY